MTIAREIAEDTDALFIEKFIMALTHKELKTKKCAALDRSTVIGFNDNSYIVFNVDGDVHLASKTNGILKIIK